MRIGKPREPFDQQLSLHEWCNDTGTGIIGYHTPTDLPAEVVEFVHSQYKRFNIPTLEKPMMDELIRVGAWAAYYLVDVYDPYVLLARGLSDVGWSHIGHTHSIEVKSAWDDKAAPEEADPERLEIFQPMPNQGEAFFNHAMAHPGLETLPYEIGDMLKMCLFDFYGGPEDFCDREAIQELQQFCFDNGVFNKARYDAYFHLAAWAAFLWFLGPPGKEWRAGNHDVFWLCETQGLAVLYDLSFISKEHYKIHERPPQSCVVCGVDAWCVELIHLDGMARFVCEKHLNPEPLYQNATCGSKACKFAVCPNHPFHGHEDAMHRMLSGSGQILRLNEQKGGMPMIAAREQRLIANK